MAKFYMIKARLLDNKTGKEVRLVWTVAVKGFFQTPVDLLKDYMAEVKVVHPNLGFDLTEFKEV